MNSKPTLRLVDRLRGIYRLPVNDGCGLLNGSDTFEPDEPFPTPPIQKEAADTLESLAETFKAINRRLSNGSLTFDELMREAGIAADLARGAIDKIEGSTS